MTSPRRPLGWLDVIVAAALSGLVFFTLGFLLPQGGEGVTPDESTTPPSPAVVFTVVPVDLCPEEDSCHFDYVGGVGWIVVPGGDGK